MRVVVVAAAGLLAANGVARAQGSAAGSGVTQPKLMPRDADPGWEVVTVRPSDPNEDEKRRGFRVDGRHVIVQQQTVEYMLMVAYGLQKNQILNAPEWVKTENFDADGVPDTEGQPVGNHSADREAASQSHLKGDTVAKASEASFPASDAPAYTH